jgi:hypothetical protein
LFLRLGLTKLPKLASNLPCLSLLSSCNHRNEPSSRAPFFDLECSHLHPGFPVYSLCKWYQNVHFQVRCLPWAPGKPEGQLHLRLKMLLTSWCQSFPSEPPSCNPYGMIIAVNTVAPNPGHCPSLLFSCWPSLLLCPHNSHAAFAVPFPLHSHSPRSLITPWVAILSPVRLIRWTF